MTEYRSILRRLADAALYAIMLAATALGMSRTSIAGEAHYSQKIIFEYTNAVPFNAWDGPLLVDANGIVYGTTYYGGEYLCCIGSSCGLIFKLERKANSSAWKFEVVHRFLGGDKAQGANPAGNLVSGEDGSIYGATHMGGVNCAAYGGCGTIYKITPQVHGAARYETVYDFSGGEDGSTPNWLTIAPDGTLYGTTVDGGRGDCVFNRLGCGTVFSLTPPSSPNGKWQKRTLHTFVKKVSGNPQGVVFGPNGNLYGTTWTNRASVNGALFELARPRKGETKWRYSTLKVIPDMVHAVPVADRASKIIYGTDKGKLFALRLLPRGPQLEYIPLPDGWVATSVTPLPRGGVLVPAWHNRQEKVDIISVTPGKSSRWRFRNLVKTRLPWSSVALGKGGEMFAIQTIERPRGLDEVITWIRP